MEAGEKSSELQSLLEAIKACDDLEERISLLSQLEDSFQIEAANTGNLADYLVVLWEDEAHDSASHCILHKMILQIAMKCMDADSTTCLSQFIILGSKASSWCARHLKEKTGAIDELHDENHSITFQQVILDGLVFASNLISVLKSNHIAKEDTNLMLITETFISALLNLTKASIIDNKKIHNASSELLKVAQNILEGIRAFCTTYSDVSKMLITTKEEKFDEIGELNFTSIVSRITNHVIKTSYEIGVFVASGGGTHVTLLNISWKGVVTLLQANKGFLDEKLNLGDIITTLISLALEMLKSACESWSVLTLNTGPSIAEAKRAFLPIKFFLINAVRICTAFPSEALAVQREIVGCALVISNLGFYFSKETQLRAASEALAEFVDPMSFLLLQAVLNSVAMDLGAQSEVFGCLFQNKQDVGFLMKTEEPDTLASVFSKDCNSPLLGGVILYLNLLRISPSLGECTTIELSKYLGNLFSILVDENTYPFVLGLEVPVLENSKPTPQITWQPMYTFVVQTLKAFLISLAALDAVAWMEVETVLLENLFHVHFLCVEITTELLSFVLRHAEAALTYQIMENILSLVRLVAPRGLRPKIAHAFNTLLACASSDVVDRIYTLVSNDEKSGIYLQLLMEGFPFDSLSDNVKRIAIRRLFMALNEFMEAYCRDNGGGCTNLTGFPVHALASALLFCNLKAEVFDEKTISLFFKFTNSLTHSYKNAPDNTTSDSLVKLMSSMLDIISETKQLYGYPEIRTLIADIHSFFIPKSNANTIFLPSLARFIAGLSNMEVPESNGNPMSTAIWDLNHMLLRERHWAVMHQAVAAFGYYAAHTTCTQLWQFVPDDAALCYDAKTGMVTDENRFMSELKAFLEKEVAVSAAVFSGDEFGFLKKEGESLQKKIISCADSAIPMEMCKQEVLSRKKRKIPEGFSEGVVLLQSGLKAMRGVLDQNDMVEFENEISSHMACLENVISHLVCLSDS